MPNQAIVLIDKIVYYTSVKNSQNNFSRIKNLVEILKRKVGFGITTENESSRVKNAINYASLYADLQKIPHSSISNTMSFSNQEQSLLKNGFFVTFPEDGIIDSKATEDIGKLALKYEQLYFNRYICQDTSIEMQRIKSETMMVEDKVNLVEIDAPDLHPVFWSKDNTAVFHNLKDAIKVLKEVKTHEANQLLEIADACGIDKSYDKELQHPFVVIEGLDGTGKTTLAETLQRELGAKILHTPPSDILPLQEYFNMQPELIKRAFYTIGNFIAAKQICELKSKFPVILDRFWSSTTAYTIAAETEGTEAASLPPVGHWVYDWPTDLIKPHLNLLLYVDEDIRIKRIHNRPEVLTKEELKLNAQNGFRKRILESYRRMSDPQIVQIDASKSPSEVAAAVIDKIKSVPHF